MDYPAFLLGENSEQSSNSSFFVCSSCRGGRRFQAVDVDVAQPLQDTLGRKTALLPLEAIKRGMKCGKNGIGCVGDIKKGQLSAFHCFSEQPRK